MLKKENRDELTKDFIAWGADKVRRVLEMTKKHGVICSSVTYATKTKG